MLNRDYRTMTRVELAETVAAFMAGKLNAQKQRLGYVNLEQVLFLVERDDNTLPPEFSLRYQDSFVDIKVSYVDASDDTLIVGYRISVAGPPDRRQFEHVQYIETELTPLSSDYSDGPNTWIATSGNEVCRYEVEMSDATLRDVLRYLDLVVARC